MFADTGGGEAHHAGVEDGLAVGGIKRRDGHAPRALAGDAPVGAGGHGALDPVDTPLGHPLDPVDLGQGPGAEGGSGNIMIDADEPLVHGAEDHRGLAAPAMRVAVRVGFVPQQVGGFAEQREHRLVGIAAAVLLQDRLPDQRGGHLLFDRQIRRVGEAAVIIDGRVNRQSDLDAGHRERDHDGHQQRTSGRVWGPGPEPGDLWLE